MPYSLQATGDPREGFTVMEIEDEHRMVARVFELETGWHIHIFVESKLLFDREFVEAVQDAQRALSHYVNRTGKGMPDGLTVGAAALWLMQRDDGKGLWNRG